MGSGMLQTVEPWAPLSKVPLGGLHRYKGKALRKNDVDGERPWMQATDIGQIFNRRPFSVGERERERERDREREENKSNDNSNRNNDRASLTISSFHRHDYPQYPPPRHHMWYHLPPYDFLEESWSSNSRAQPI